MTGIETIIRTELDHRYPAPAREADWDGVLQRVAEIGESPGSRWVGALASRRTRRRGAFALAATALAAAAVSLTLVAPWSGGPNVVQQALAAIGNGRYVHAVFQSTTSAVRWVDLASGRTRPVSVRSEWVYDTKTGTYDASAISGGLVRGGAPTSPDPTVSRFASGYRNALAGGEAHVIGERIVDGNKATLIRFSIRDGLDHVIAYEDVAVSVASHAPLWIRYVNVNAHRARVGRQVTYRVVSIGSSNERPTLPRAQVELLVTGNATDIRRVTAKSAEAAFGHTPLWPGQTIAGASLQSMRLQRVTTVLVSGFRLKSSARGLRLDYRGPLAPLVIEQAASAQRGYGFWSATYGTSGPLPPIGQAVLACDGCSTAGGPPHPVWQAQLRKDGLFSTIRSPSRSLVLAAARALAPIP